MTDELILFMPPVGGDPTWWITILNMYHEVADYKTPFDEYVLTTFGALLIRATDNYSYAGLKFNSKPDMLHFMLKYS